MNATTPNRPLCTFVVTMLLAGVALTGCATTSPSPSVAGPTSTPAGSGPVPSGTVDGGCPVGPQTGLLRSNTLLDMRISSDGLSDRIVFTLGDRVPEPTGGTGRLEAVQPPFVRGGSGEPVDVLGAHHVQLHLDGMLVADDAGNPMYGGPQSVKPNMLSLKQVDMLEAFEGVYNFVLGYDGNGCVGLAEDAAAKTLTITIGH